MTDQPPLGSVLGTIVMIIIVAFFYFLPSIIGQKKQNFGAILCLNLFLGWTVLGWIVALVWAATQDTQAVVIAQPLPVAPRPGKQCPDCAEIVLADARKCRFCGHAFN